MRAMTESSERLSDARAAASETYVRPVAAVADSDARRKAATNLSAHPEQSLNCPCSRPEWSQREVRVRLLGCRVYVLRRPGEHRVFRVSVLRRPGEHRVSAYCVAQTSIACPCRAAPPRPVRPPSKKSASKGQQAASCEASDSTTLLTGPVGP